MSSVADIRRKLLDAGADVTSLELAEFLWLASRLPAPEPSQDLEVSAAAEEPLHSDEEGVDDGIRMNAHDGTEGGGDTEDGEPAPEVSASLGSAAASTEPLAERPPETVDVVIDIDAGLNRPYDFMRTIRRFAKTSEVGAAAVDVRASAEASARAHAPIIVSRRRNRAVTRLLILEDQAPQLAPWRRAFDDLVRLAHESNTFDEVSRAFIRLADPNGATIIVRSGAPFDVNTFVRAGRDHVVLLLSDALGGAVDSGALGSSLASFPEGTRIAWANPWSTERWRRSRLAKLRRVRPTPLEVDAASVATAVAEFHLEGLQQLAEWVGGFRVASLSGWRLPTRMTTNRSALRASVGERDWFEHLRRLSAALSPAALRLLGLAAAIPGYVDVDLLLRLGSEFSAKPSRLDVAEAITTGLLTANAVESGETNVVLSFRSVEARRAALGLIERRELDRVLRWLVALLDEPAGRERARRLRLPIPLLLRSVHRETADEMRSEALAPDAESVWTTIVGSIPAANPTPVRVALTETPLRGPKRMAPLPSPLRRRLEKAVTDARDLATNGARKALEALAVHEPDPYRHMSGEQRDLRRRLRAQARQLGDEESKTKRGAYSINHLVEKIAYDQWHRLLFARFLFENDLLISPEHGVSVSFHDCEELAPALGLRDAWEVAARFAAKELPEIFRADDPAGEVVLPVEERNPLIALVNGLPLEVFTASDSIGWCYQFWQAEKKDKVNASGVKIGADELPAVTQLFTEDYMVDFLLDNSLGSWWAAKVLAANPDLARTAKDEEELRAACALPNVPWSYLRFIRESEETVPEKIRRNAEELVWRPAAGTFSRWPKQAKEITCLDPCMGSGHFIVAMFERMVALRMHEEGLDERDAVAEVIRDNVFGLEIDPRCTQIAAFNLAFNAWRRAEYQTLPPFNLACSGAAPNRREPDWLAIAGANEKLQRGMKRLYALFMDAPLLGSLINPRLGGGELLEAAFHELQPLLDRALASDSRSDGTQEMAVAALGLARAANILSGQFTLVATNVPYLGRGKQDPVLARYCEDYYPNAKADLATCFIDRSLSLAGPNGDIALVTPQSWLTQDKYETFRRQHLTSSAWKIAAQLGTGAFATISGEIVKPLLFVTAKGARSPNKTFMGFDVVHASFAEQKADALRSIHPTIVKQAEQLLNPRSRVSFEGGGQRARLSDYCRYSNGIQTGDSPRFSRSFWEFAAIESGWAPKQTTVEQTALYAGLSELLWWEDGQGELAAFVREKLQSENAGVWLRGQRVWGNTGVLVSAMGRLKVSRYLGGLFDDNTVAIVPTDERDEAAVWTACSDSSFHDSVRKIDKKLNVRGPLVEIPFDLAFWRAVAAERYPNGFPIPSSSDPTQWLFNGNPRESDHPLHVAVVRLLGYEWPRQTGSRFPGCPALKPDGLFEIADHDGIVPLGATKGERSGADRLRELLASAIGKEWSGDEQELLAQVGYGGKTLDDWLRDGFFEQHSAIFHNRPFVWHVWDGHRNGFSALINYHKLTQANLESLTYSYLGDWIRRQQAAVEAGEAGSDARLAAAKELQESLKHILDGEPPYDIFVRWKPLVQQPIGWDPDLNDGVRMNIRPFVTAGVLRKRVNGINWNKDRGKEPMRDKTEYPWYWGWDGQTEDFRGGHEFDGNRWNDLHYSIAMKKRARGERV